MQDDSRERLQPEEARPHVDERFAARVLFVFGMAAVFLFAVALFWYAANVLIVGFASVLVAILLADAANMLARRLPLSHGAALAVTLVIVALMLAATGLLLAPRIASQVSELSADLPAALEHFRSYLFRHPALQQLEQQLPSPGKLFADASIASRAGLIFSNVLGVVGNAAVILFVAIYLAASPRTYIEGALKLLPPGRRPRARMVFRELGLTLTLWLRGKLLSMVIVGCALAISLALLDVPLALTLGILAGLLDFIPYIGPILAAIPAVLIAFAQEPSKALLVAAVFTVLQTLEGYLLLPMVERRTVSMPPALTVMMQVLMGIAFGLAGVAVATPLTAMLSVLIAMLYVQDVLDDPVQLPAKK